MLGFVLSLYALCVAGLLWVETQSQDKAKTIFKALAAFGFIFIAIFSGAVDSLYGQLILAALILCAIGDMCLLPDGDGLWFKLGMAAFAGGHSVYVIAFLSGPLSLKAVLVFGAVLILMGAPFYIWLRRFLPKDMKALVGLYTLIISAMVASAALSSKTTLNVGIFIPAALFALSDMAVARERFVTPHVSNFWIITPLYFGAQALFALSV